ncbi:Ankyrin repeat protein [Rickettsiales bacterium Ac37b]|nr:Ankyrin repeat protein [Rickettsiales bacterium Ac37b]
MKDIEIITIADLYIEEIEDNLLFQYRNIAEVLFYTLHYLYGNTVKFPASITPEIKDQIELIKNIPSKLKENLHYDYGLSEQILVKYLQTKINFYMSQHEEIKEIIAEKNPLNQQNIIHGLINNKVKEKALELKSRIVSKYDHKNGIIGYNENTASPKNKQAWLNRDQWIENKLEQKLKSWKIEEENNYMTAVKVYNNPEQADLIKKQWKEKQAREIKVKQALLTHNEQQLRMAKREDSTEDYLLVQENILTKEEAMLFNYEELNIYKLYYAQHENKIKEIFQLAKNIYSGNQNKGLQELSEVKYDKINFLFVFINNLFEYSLSFKDIAKYSHGNLNIIQTHSALLTIMNSEEVLSIGMAVYNNDNKNLNTIISNLIPHLQKEENSLYKLLTWATEQRNNYWVNNLLDLLGNSITIPVKINILYVAVDNEYLDGVSILLEKLGNEIPINHKIGVLREAVEGGYLEIVNLLLDKLGNEIPTANKIIILKEALENGYLEIINSLLEKIINELSPKDKGEILKWSIKEGHVECINILLEKLGNDITPQDKGEALYWAADQGYIEVVNTLLNKVGDEISKKDKGKALYWSAGEGQLEVVNLLLSSVGNEITLEDKGIALCWAAIERRLEVVNSLLDMIGYNITPEHIGQALYSAAVKGYREIVSTLLNKVGDKINMEDKCKALYFAAVGGYLELVNFLLDKIEDDKNVEHKGEVLHGAAVEGRIGIVNLLLNRLGKDYFTIKNKGKALYLAAGKGYLEVVNLLLDKIENITPHYKGKALYLAAEQGYTEVVKMLLARGEEITIEDKGIALYFATIKGNLKIVNILLDNLDDKITLEDKREILDCTETESDIEEVNSLLERVFTKMAAENKATSGREITKNEPKNIEHNIEKGNFERVIGKHTARYFNVVQYFNQDCEKLYNKL